MLSITYTHTDKRGFTLIELSIVLVIIGLIVGGVLVGQDLIKNAQVRAAITQIEKYNAAVNSFRSKYDALPGDINALQASRFGFTARGAYAGEGDGNNVIEGIGANAPASNCGECQVTGETALFWVDLSTARLIDGSFNTANAIGMGGYVLSPTSSPPINAFFPESKLGGGNYVYVWSGGLVIGSNGNSGDGRNYFGIAMITGNAGTSLLTTTNITVTQAYNIDRKVDDGIPQTGNVKAAYISPTPQWAGNSTPWSTAGSASTCYDNNGAPDGTQMQYSITQNGGRGANCALIFAFQ